MKRRRSSGDLPSSGPNQHIRVAELRCFLGGLFVFTIMKQFYMGSRAYIIHIGGFNCRVSENEMKFLGPDAYDRSMILPVPR